MWAPGISSLENAMWSYMRRSVGRPPPALCEYDMAAGLAVKESPVRPSEALAANREAIRRVVESHRARNARVFGSVLHGTDTTESDLDILVEPTERTTLFDLGAIRRELLQILGVPVDVLTPRALPDEFRDKVLAEAVPI
jgi:uncharacterized protein